MEKQKSGHIQGGVFIRRLVLALIGLILGVSIYWANANGIMRKQMPMPFGYGIAVILSGSMEPALSVNDLIIVKASAKPEIGDVVVYESGQNLVVHRVIQMNENQIITQGDANNAADEPFSKDQVIGVVRTRVRGAGRLVEWIRKPWVIFCIVVGMFAIEERSFRKQREQEDDELQQLKEEIRRLKETK